MPNTAATQPTPFDMELAIRMAENMERRRLTGEQPLTLAEAEEQYRDFR